MTRFAASIVAVAGLAAAASAQSVSYSDATTADGPRWNRPVQNGNSTPTGLSGTGTNTPYHVQAFHVGTSGSYGFSSLAADGWDNYLFLYSGSFNAASPLTGVVIGNDDNPGIGQSGFSSSLTAGTQYFLVTTGFGNADLGAFTNTIVWSQEVGGGPITLGLIPTPGAAALLGLGGLAASRRRRA